MPGRRRRGRCALPPLLLLLLFSLACGGSGSGTPSPCDQPPLPAPSAPATLAANLAATPAWAATFETGGLHVEAGNPGVQLAQVRNTAGWFASASSAVPDGGLLLCRFELARSDGYRKASVGPLDGVLVRVSDATFAPQDLVVGVPAVRLAAGASIRVRGGVERTDCTRLDPFWVLTTGLPIPDCVTRGSRAVDQLLPWGTAGAQVSCRSVPRTTALEQAISALGSLRPTLEAMCGAAMARPYDAARWKMQADAAAGFLYEAAGWAGWADPAVQDGLARYVALGGGAAR